MATGGIGKASTAKKIRNSCEPFASGTVYQMNGPPMSAGQINERGRNGWVAVEFKD
jgi:hypothetical protein